MKIYITSKLVILFIIISSVTAEDKFDQIKKELKEAECTRIEFISVLESEVFETIDSTYGEAYIAADGRYLVKVGDDIYLNDLKKLYSFSFENNQVIVEKIFDGDVASEEITFITKLDSFYSTKVIKKDMEYELQIKEDVVSNIPEKLVAIIDPELMKLKMINYLDINEELNRIIILSQNSFIKCDENKFIPHFPETAEILKL